MGQRLSRERYLQPETPGESGCFRIDPVDAFDGHVFVVDAESRLRRRDVDVLFSQADFVCLERGLSPGERVIVSNPAPAIEGMLIEPVVDADWATSLREQAVGEAASP